MEDEASVRDALSKILESAGHHVVAAGDGPEALEIFKQGGFDVVMTDLSLPVLSGWEIADEVKRQSPDTPVVLLSGWDIDEDEVRAHVSVSRILSKPVKVKELLRAINDIVFERPGG